jgi:hypothetical protein
MVMALAGCDSTAAEHDGDQHDGGDKSHAGADPGPGVRNLAPATAGRPRPPDRLTQRRGRDEHRKG